MGSYKPEQMRLSVPPDWRLATTPDRWDCKAATCLESPSHPCSGHTRSPRNKEIIKRYNIIFYFSVFYQNLTKRQGVFHFKHICMWRAKPQMVRLGFLHKYTQSGCKKSKPLAIPPPRCRSFFSNRSIVTFSCFIPKSWVKMETFLFSSSYTGEMGVRGWSMAAEISLLMSSNSVAVFGLAVLRGLEDIRPAGQ